MIAFCNDRKAGYLLILTLKLMVLFKKAMLLCMVFINAFSYAIYANDKCNLQVSITAIDEQTNQPILSASIGFGKSFSLSDMNGWSVMENVCLGKNHLHIQAIGYENIDKDVIVSGNDSLKVFMKVARKSLDEVEITGHKQVLSTTATATTLDKSELNKTAGGSLANAVETIAGVSMLQTGATISKPVINGMHSNRILVLNNGVRQEGQQWGVEHAPEIDPFSAQTITVVKGAAAIQYGGDAMGGVILVDPAPLPTDSLIHGSLNLVGVSNGQMGAASGMLSGNFKKLPALSWLVQGTAKKGGNLKTADYFLDNTGMNELNYSVAAGYIKRHFDADVYYSHFNTELGIFKGSEIGSIEDLEKHITLGRPIDDGSFSYVIGAPKQSVIHDLLKIKAHVHLNDYLHLTAQYSFQTDARKEFDIRRGGRSSIPSLDLSLNDQSLNVSLDYFNGKAWKGNIGIVGNRQENKNIPGTLTTPLIPDYISENLGVFAIANFLKTNYQIEAGIRYDYKYLSALGYDLDHNLYGGIRNFNNVSGSLGAIWDINPRWNLNTNIGSAWRSPSVNELYSNGLHTGAASYEMGDSTLKSEIGLKWITSLQFKNAGNWLNISLDGYMHYFNDYIYLNPSGQLYQSLQGAFPTFNYAQTNARFLGTDLNLNIAFLKHFDYNLKGSLIRAKDISNNRYLPTIPTDRLEQAIRWKYDPVPYLKDSYVEFSHVFVARQNQYEPLSDYTQPPDAYHLLKVGLGTTLLVNKQSLNINFSINNLANTEYKDYMDRFRYYAHDLGRSYELRLAYVF